MINHHENEIYAQTRQQHLQREAEQHQLVQQIQQDKPQRSPIAPTLVRIGQALSQIGEGLQSRYSAASSLPARPAPTSKARS